MANDDDADRDEAEPRDDDEDAEVPRQGLRERERLGSQHVAHCTVPYLNTLLGKGGPVRHGRAIGKAALVAAVMGSVLVMLAPPAAAAVTRFVATNGSDTVPVNNQCTNSLQPCRTVTRGHLVSVAGDTINVAAGTYQERLTITKGVTIQGAGAASTTIDAFSTATAGGAVMVVNLAAGQPTLTVNGVTMTRGFSNFGAGMGIFTGTVVVNDSAITNNNTLNGTGGAGVGVLGTAFGTTQHVTLNRVTISGNTATNGNGGGVWSAGPIVATDTTITNNRATTTSAGTGLGGGIALVKAVTADAPSITATGATVTQNTATSGAGLYTTATATFTDSAFTQNAANASSGVGGGIDVVKPTAADLATVTLGDTTVSRNSAFAGGGVAVNGGGQLTVNNGSVFDQNSSPFGGALYNAGTSTVDASSFTANTSTFEAGGILDGSFVAADTPVLTLTNTNITGSTAASFGGGVVVANKATLNMTGGALSNSTSATAGGLYLQFGGIASITNVVLANNKATAGNGGAILASGGLTLTGSQLTGNSAVPVSGNNQTGTGGALHVGKTVATDTPNAVVDSTTFRSNSAWLGGAVGVNSGSTLTLRNGSLLDQNTASNSGGGLYNAGATTIAATTFTANTGAIAGGAVYDGSVVAADAPTLATTDAIISGNSAGLLGGGISVVAKAALTMNGGSITGNSAPTGGGLSVNADGTAVLNSTSLTGNQATGAIANTGFGGAIVSAGLVTVNDASISNNKAMPASGQLGTTGFGGGIYSGSNAPGPQGVKVALRRVLLSGNSANSGSAIYAAAPTITSLRDSTVTGNTAGPGAGAIVALGAMSLAGDTINANTAPVATNSIGGVYVFAPSSAAGTIIYGNSNGNCFGAPADGGYNITNPGDTGCAFNAATDIKADPKLNPLANNGGPTLTEMPQPSSPAINKIPTGTVVFNDAVSGAPITLCPSVDQRGVARPQGPSCDIGAVEVGNVAPTIAGPASATFVVGSPGSVGFTSTGVPTPQLSAAGGLPAGVTFVDNGDGTATLAGTPQAGTANTYPLTITAANGNAPNATLNFTLTVINPLAITTTTLPHGIVSVPYAASLTATGGTTPYTWTLASGSLPNGLSLASNGSISGTPTGPPGSSTFTVTVTDSTNPIQTASKALTIVVDAAPTISGPASATFVTGTPGSVGFTSTGSPTPTLSATGTLPAGVTFTDHGDGTGTLGGTAAAGSQGVYPLTIKAANGVGSDATLSFTLTVVAPVVITTTSLPEGTVGSPYVAGLTANGGTPPYTWSLASGSLPAGLTLAPNGTISGTPTGPRGTSTFTVQATDATTPTALSDTKQLSIVIHATPTQLIADPAFVRIQFPGVIVSVQNLKARLTSGAGPVKTPVVGAPIQFSVAGTVYCLGFTDSTGTAYCPGLHPQLALAILLNNGFEVTYAGSPTLEPAAAHAPAILIG